MDGAAIEDPVLRQQLRFERTVDAHGRDVLVVDIRVAPGGGVTPHVHPATEERFQVLAGRPDFLDGFRWRAAAPGETVVVPPGRRHAYRNRSQESVHLVCHASPPSTLQPFLETVAALSRAGRIRRPGLPKDLDTVLLAAALAHEHRDMVVLGFPPMPPAPIQRLIFPLLARVAARRRTAARPV